LLPFFLQSFSNIILFARNLNFLFKFFTFCLKLLYIYAHERT
jgi:hypothetical protein